MGSPSVRELRTNTSKAAKYFAASGTGAEPAKATGRERFCARGFGRALGAVAQNHSADNRVGDGGQRIDEHIDPLLPAHAAHPPREKPFGRQSKRSTGVVAAEGRGVCGEGVRHDMEVLRGDAAGAELVSLRCGNDDDRIEPPENEPLQLFIGAVPQPSTGKTVHGGYYGESRFAPRMPAHDVRPVTMCVYDTYTTAAA